MVQVHLGKHKAHKAHCKWHSSQNGAMHVGAHADCAANGASDIKNREAHTRTHTHTRKNLFLQRGLRISKLPSCSTNKNTDAQSSFVPWKSIIISPLAEFGSFLPTGEKKTGRNLEPGRKFKSLEAQSTYRWCSSKSFVFLKKYIMYCFPH